MEKVEDWFYGAVTKGVNHSTVVFVKGVLVGLLLTLSGLFVLSLARYPSLTSHITFMWVLAVGLLVLLTWFFSEIGEISPAEQREELFGKPADKSAGKPAPVEPKKAQ
eukprot:jgi/Astpho2/2903/Aster-x0118